MLLGGRCMGRNSQTRFVRGRTRTISCFMRKPFFLSNASPICLIAIFHVRHVPPVPLRLLRLSMQSRYAGSTQRRIGSTRKRVRAQTRIFSCGKAEIRAALYDGGWRLIGSVIPLTCRFFSKAPLPDPYDADVRTPAFCIFRSIQNEWIRPGPIDKVGSQIGLAVVQDCFLGAVLAVPI